MRTLYLLRHAKSSWHDPSLADHDRPLASRGIRATPYVADHLRQIGIVPDVVLCSSSRRTRQTLDLLGDAIPSDTDVRIEEELYHAAADTLLDRLRLLPDSARRAMLIGHNPAMQQLAVLLAASGDHLERMARKFPTAALATLDAAIDGWADLAAGCAELAGFVRPDDLNAPR
ncbi:MAG TPA: histidine phosphatase family protein [Euzebyales bacterium]|nr:histidine phosphatase family protein [Euzebyales bacterium]